MTNQEINEAVEKKLGIGIKCGCGHGYVDDEVPHTRHYATNIADAWEILDYIHKLLVPDSKQEDYWIVKINSRCGENNDKYWVIIRNFCFYDDKSNRYFDALADTAPLAICKAFLALKENT